ncbi:MAG TPA: PstS family phosphate ABC transporter substrate-binding protein [Gaiellaceae bacterium]|nr:PstS family phosphate ABC transporter substrate-binding protein [Gaiellaceae bacterium]
MKLRVSPTLFAVALVATAVGVFASACGGREGRAQENGATPAAQQVSGTITADGSSTVGPLSTSAAEMFQAEQPDVRVTVGVSGTGGGFERFCRAETDLSNASRPIKADEEEPVCKENGVEYTEFEVAIDALTVVVGAENDWVDCLTVEQLKAIWAPDSKIDNWSEVPGGGFPDRPLTLAGPGTDSGTFDYFTDAVVGEEGASRSDYTASEDDNVIVQAVAGDEGALGYFGFTYYEENQDRLKAVAVDGGEGCVEASPEAAQTGEYQPLSRPLFVYVNNASLARPEVEAFMRYYLENLDGIAEAAQYIPLAEERRDAQLAKLDKAAGA